MHGAWGRTRIERVGSSKGEIGILPFIRFVGVLNLPRHAGTRTIP